ncbi:hypothetical protein CBM2594_A80507 [Cupriavidus taiwanensis]|uniref:Uncharacterized protein n=1 Tax=Cupriavidus taiwanensis TaxID=164546 RepID=A0A7Z7J9W3_9BURK|nr:hypothetical protein CBM2594_A80507 [Cupriavidus taiwanensis]
MLSGLFRAIPQSNRTDIGDTSIALFKDRQRRSGWSGFVESVITKRFFFAVAVRQIPFVEKFRIPSDNPSKLIKLCQLAPDVDEAIFLAPE